MQPTDPYLLNPVLNALQSIDPEEAEQAVMEAGLAVWAETAERLATEAVGAGEWARHKDEVANSIEDLDLEDISAEQAAGKLVGVYKSLKAKAAAEESRKQGKAIVAAARAGNYRDFVRGQQ